MQLASPPLTLRHLVLLDMAVLHAGPDARDLWPCIGRRPDGTLVPLPAETDPLLQGGPWPVGWERIGPVHAKEDGDLVQEWQRADGLSVQLPGLPDGSPRPETAQILWGTFMIVIDPSTPPPPLPSRTRSKLMRSWPDRDTAPVYAIGGLSADQAHRLRDLLAALVVRGAPWIRAKASLMEILGWTDDGWSNLPTDPQESFPS